MQALAIFLGLTILTLSRAEIIDRVAVALDNQVITQSEIMQEIRVTSFLNGESLDFSPGARRQAADRLIEQKLIRREIALGRYAQPSLVDADSSLEQVKKQRFTSEAEYREALEKYGLKEDELKAHLLWQITLLRFVGVRFRPSIQVSAEQTHQYFEKQQGEMEKVAGKPLVFDEARDDIEEILIAQQVDQQLDRWLAQARERAHIEFRSEVFQ